MRRNLQNEIRWLLEEKHGGKRTEAAEKDIARLEKGEHIDYVIGWVEFLGCKIDLSQKPLIPRPETEYWTEKFLQDARAATFPGALPPPFGADPRVCGKVAALTRDALIYLLVLVASELQF